MIYLAPNTRMFFDKPTLYGCMFNISRMVGGQMNALQAGCTWMLENNRFANGFIESLWHKELDTFKDYKDTCLGIVIPDWPFNASGTLDEFWKYQHIPKVYGYRVALVTQNGMTTNDIPWPEIDTLFIGGDDAHKRGLEGQTLALAAKERGKWVHVGRCNSGGEYLKRNGKVRGAMLKHWTWADSADGTTLIKHPTQQIASIENGLNLINGGAGHQLILLEKDK